MQYVPHVLSRHFELKSITWATNVKLFRYRITNFSPDDRNRYVGIVFTHVNAYDDTLENYSDHIL